MKLDSNIVAAIIVTLPPTLVALLAYLRVKKLHIEVNGKMEQLLDLTSQEAFSRGELKGAQDERTHHEDD